jgi:uncharacterized membrane-anchored protein
MNRARIETLWRQAQDRRLLPADAAPPAAAEGRPWPVVLLTALGAWLAAVPLLIVIGIAFGPMLQHGGAYLRGVALLATAGVILRSVSLPLFVEQLAVPLLLTGGASLGFALFDDLPETLSAALLAALALAISAVVRPHWLKACLGGAAACFVALAFWPWHWGGQRAAATTPYWLSWHFCVAVWLAVSLWDRSAALRASVLATASGWAAMSLLGLALSSGSAMLVGSALGGLGGFGGLGGPSGLAWAGWPGGVSVVLAFLAAAWLGRAWPSLRRPGYVGVAVVLAGLAGFMPALGAVLLMAAVCLVQARWQLASAAALAAVWVVSAFYYQLAWPLATKAEVLAVAGVLLGLLAWPLWHRTGAAAPTRDAAGHGLRIGAAVSLVAVLAVINVGIAQKEALIAEGQPVFVALAPADPRSLMQGDFMRLNFALPANLRGDEPLLTDQRPHAVARLDDRRVAQLVRLHAGEPLAADEVLIELTPKDGRWTLVTDAWFFKEGEAQRWSAAKFGEFRIKPDGQALLVGLRSADLGKL